MNLSGKYFSKLGHEHMSPVFEKGCLEVLSNLICSNLISDYIAGNVVI